MTNIVQEAIAKTRVDVGFGNRAFTDLEVNMVAVDASDWCETMAVSGKELFFNSDFVAYHTTEQLNDLVAKVIQAAACSYPLDFIS